MPLVSKADLARLAGVKPPAISQAIRKARVVVDASGKIDTENPVNISYIDAAKHTKSSGRGGLGKSSETLKPPQARASASLEGLGLRDQQLRADIEVKERNAERLSIANAQKLEELLVRDRVAQRIGQLGGAIRASFLPLPHRLAHRLHALALSGAGPRALEGLLEEEVTAALRAAKEAAVHAELDSFTSE